MKKEIITYICPPWCSLGSVDGCAADGIDEACDVAIDMNIEIDFVGDDNYEGQYPLCPFLEEHIRQLETKYYPEDNK